MIRLLLYGFAFYMTIRISYLCGFAALLGFMTQKIALYYVLVIKPKFTKKTEEEPGPPKQYNDLDKDGWPEKKRWYDYDYDREKEKAKKWINPKGR